MSEKMRVLIVDDEPNNITVLSELLMDEYELAIAMNGQDAIDIAREEPKPDLILLDIMMPGMDGYDVCKTLKADKDTASIPVIFVTAMGEIEDETKGFSVGAVDYITKPISPPVVKARVATHVALAHQHRACEMLVEKQVKKIRESQKDAVYMLGSAGHYNDDDTGAHIWRMASYSKAIAKAANWSVGKQNMLLLAAAMHDTGKIGIPDSILKKPGKLDDKEWIKMRKHSEYGHKILSVAKSPLFVMASEIALYHHERWEGGGYPKNLQGEDIPEAARIVAIADVFDALTMQRPYKDAWPIERAMEYIGNSNGHFEPRLSEIFASIEDEIVSIKEHWGKKEKNVTMIDS
ncbi:response regulator [Maridesulfovibrio frigidus]|uniref:response regulator n=1 Tax=Maridesulfovibrio frigidus TaxID=340956 RepID=UPI0004E12026|nr:HD domain-containing phosphohydrolase [Maridesulfovibrio frigidus]